jgi:hypothetical protein
MPFASDRGRESGQESNMRTRWLAALSLIGVAAFSVPILATPATASAQGIYFDGPGFGFGIGAPYGGRYHRYYDYDEPYGHYGRPYCAPRSHYQHYYRW